MPETTKPPLMTRRQIGAQTSCQNSQPRIWLMVGAAQIWLVWVKERAPAPAQMFRVPPGCREALTRAEDRTRYAAWSINLTERIAEHAA